MGLCKADIIHNLQKDILLLQGFKPSSTGLDSHILPTIIEDCFPNSCFPVGAVHEFICSTHESIAATTGFSAAIMAALMARGGNSMWVTSEQIVFPPSLTWFGIVPENILFIKVSKQKHILAVLEEGLKYDGFSCVIAGLNELSFVESRKLQLAVEQSKVTGLIYRQNPKNLATTSVARWQVESISSEDGIDVPGVGFPSWNIHLQKARNGKTGSWQIQWATDGFKVLEPFAVPEIIPLRKVG